MGTIFLVYIYNYIRTPTRLHYPARLRARVNIVHPRLVEPRLRLSKKVKQVYIILLIHHQSVSELFVIHFLCASYGPTKSLVETDFFSKKHAIPCLVVPDHALIFANVHYSSAYNTKHTSQKIDYQIIME